MNKKVAHKTIIIALIFMYTLLKNKMIQSEKLNRYNTDMYLN